MAINNHRALKKQKMTLIIPMNNRFIWDLGKDAIHLTLKLWPAASAAVPEIFWENIKKFCPVNEKASVTDFL